MVLPLDIPVRLLRSVDARWREIVLPDGRSAFIQAGDVEPLPPGAYSSEAASPAPAAAPTTTADTSAAERAVRHRARATVSGDAVPVGRALDPGVDCSGLVSSSMVACGLLPPRDAGPQYDWNRTLPVPQEVSALRPGTWCSSVIATGRLSLDLDLDADLAGKPRDPRLSAVAQRVKHVGIYVGDGRFLHATTHEHPVVQESRIS